VVWFVKVTDQLRHLFAYCNIFKIGTLLFHISDYFKFKLKMVLILTCNDGFGLHHIFAKCAKYRHFLNSDNILRTKQYAFLADEGEKIYPF